MGLLSIMVDSREPEWCQQLSFGGASKFVCALEYGDILASCDDNALIAIERKKATDLLNTLRDDRLFPQMAGLSQITPWAYLAICDDLRAGPGGKCLVDGRESGWNWASVQGALLTVQELGIKIVQVASDMDYEAAVLRLCNRDRQVVNVRPARDTVLMSTDQIILASLPGIGAEKAKALLEHCGSAAWAINYLTSTEREDVPGIGYATRMKIKRALGLQYDETLGVVIKETGNQREESKEREKELVA